jgi:hypothetical protein
VPVLQCNNVPHVIPAIPTPCCVAGNSTHASAHGGALLAVEASWEVLRAPHGRLTAAAAANNGARLSVVSASLYCHERTFTGRCRAPQLLAAAAKQRYTTFELPFGLGHHEEDMLSKCISHRGMLPHLPAAL